MSEQNSEPSRPFDPPMPPTQPPTAPPAPPEAPPVPPAAPERPAVPQYGEYAPVVPPNPYGVPGYAAAPSAPVAPAVPNPYPTAAYGAPAMGAPAYAPVGRQRKTWDLVLTIVLLAIGAIGALAGATSGLGLNQAIQQQYDAHGLGTYSGSNGAAVAILAISHLVLYVVAVGLSILSLTKKRTTFWIPLVIGVVAAIIFWSVLIGVIVGDTPLMNALTAG